MFLQLSRSDQRECGRAANAFYGDLVANRSDRLASRCKHATNVRKTKKKKNESGTEEEMKKGKQFKVFSVSVPVLSDANLDGAALRHITEESLLNYGVTQLGVRKRLLRYIEVRVSRSKEE